MKGNGNGWLEHEVVTVTPRMAEEMLNRNSANRSLRPGVVERYAADMSNGTWGHCVAPLAFYDNEDVADGQHRLFAIVESGKPQRFMVIRGLPRKDGLNIDTGVPRTLVDNARISGLDPDLSNSLLATVKAIESGERSGKGRSLSNATILDLIAKHRTAADWAIRHGPRGRFLRNSITLAAVARAWYHETDEARLIRWCEVVSSGFADGEVESAAIAIRNYILSKGTVMLSNGSWRDSFLKVQNSIHYFMRGKKLMVIKGVAEEAYPLGRKKRAA
jgi:hypothetical protein